MNVQNIDLNLFVVFDVIYSERNLTRAAERLHVTQPAVSNALRRLRDLFDDPLFVRGPEGMTPTPAARNMAGQVRESLQLLEIAASRQQEFDPAVSDKNVVVSMGDLAQILLLPRLIDKLQREAPGVSLDCVTLPRTDLELELASGSVDIAVDVPMPTARHLGQRPLLRDRYVCVVSDDHPLAGKTPSLDDYLALKHVHVSGRRRGIGHVDIALGRVGRQRNIHLRLQSHTAVLELLSGSDLAVTMPLALAKHYSLTWLELPFVVDGLHWQLLWHKSADEDPANRWLRDLVAGGLLIRSRPRAEYHGR